jgi:hypothetical protein
VTCLLSCDKYPANVCGILVNPETTDEPMISVTRTPLILRVLTKMSLSSLHHHNISSHAQKQGKAGRQPPPAREGSQLATGPPIDDPRRATTVSGSATQGTGPQANIPIPNANQQRENTPPTDQPQRSEPQLPSPPGNKTANIMITTLNPTTKTKNGLEPTLE